MDKRNNLFYRDNTTIDRSNKEVSKIKRLQIKEYSLEKDESNNNVSNSISSQLKVTKS